MPPDTRQRPGCGPVSGEPDAGGAGALDGGSRALSEDEANRVRNERQRIDERAARALSPALAAVLLPQLARAGLIVQATRRRPREITTSGDRR